MEVLPMDRLGLKQVECAVDHNIGLTDLGEVMTWGSFSGTYIILISGIVVSYELLIFRLQSRSFSLFSLNSQ
jgi:hypothetical protein